MSADVAVVGGGPAGVAAALHAARAGHSVVLLEAAGRLGGMAASVEVAGQRVDLGSHRLHPAASPAARALVEQLLGDDLQVRPRRGRLRLGRAWAGFPLRAGELLRRLPPRTAAGIAWDLATGPVRRERADTYAEVVRARLGPTVLSAFHGPYAAKQYGLPAERLAGDLARRRIALRGLRDVAARLARAERPEGRTFLYPRRGYGQIVERLADAAVAAGVEVRLRSAPATVQPAAASTRLVIDDGREVEAGRVLWTAPPSALVEAAGGPLGLGDGLVHRGVVLVYLVVDRPRWLEWDAHYVPDLDVPFVRLSEPKNYRDGPDPPDRTVLCAELAATAGDARWRADDTTLRDEVLAGIERLGLPDPRPVDHHVIRLPRVYPLLTPDAAGRLAALLRWTERLPGVTVLGRQGLGVADNLHHVLDMAAAAAACLRSGGGWDDPAWRRALHTFEGHVVED